MDTLALPPNSTWEDLLHMLNTTVSDYSDPSITTSYWPDTCTFDTCELYGSYFPYRPSRSANLAFTVLFGISAIVFLAQGITSKKWWGFTVAMLMGCVLEVIGYMGRVLAYHDMYSEAPFLIQICCLTIAPTFLAAGIYLCLSRIVIAFGHDNSHISARFYPIIFVTCDILSLVLQAAGGGIASVKTHRHQDPKLGNNIMIAGLSVQVCTLLIFVLLALEFAIRTVRRTRQIGVLGALDCEYANLRKSWQFKGFLVALSMSTLCVFTRCVYRVAELSHGWEGHLMKNQNLFIGFEGSIILVAVLLLNLFSPGFCFKESSYMRPQTGSTSSIGQRMWYGRKKPMAVVRDSSQEELKERGKSSNFGGNGGRVRGVV